MPAPPTETLIRTLPAAVREVTVADAAAASGLSLEDAQRALHALVAEYRGHLRVTEEGELLFRFPTGFTRPWETPEALTAFGRRVGAALLGALRFVVRAWVAIVLVAYALIFVAIFLALAFGRGSDDRGSERGGVLAYALLRMVSEALFWTFHPFSPFAVRGDVFQRGDRRQRDETPFYERVDRFFFGPRAAPRDPDADRRAVLAAIRAGKGRIGVGDVMRVTGAPRDAVDPLMSRLLVDYDGSVEVSEEGGIAYRFPDLRKTAPAAEALAARRPPAVWEQKVAVPPVTGNRPGQDLLIGGLNAFNLVASTWALAAGMTVERLVALVRQLPPELVPPPGLPVVLGLVPFVFSLLLFLLPLGRIALRRRTRRRVARENGRRAVLRTVLERAPSGGVDERELRERWRIAAGEEPGDRELLDEVKALGGDVDLERSGEDVRYRFVDLELEARAVEAEREAASASEARVGKVIFSSED